MWFEREAQPDGSAPRDAGASFDGARADGRVGTDASVTVDAPVADDGGPDGGPCGVCEPGDFVLGDFEAPALVPGSLHMQDGWTCTGP
jgi:hypothetical protein